MSIEKLAKLFSDRDNPTHPPIMVGQVISSSPLKVQYGDQIVLTTDELIVNKLNADGFTVQYTDSTDTTTNNRTLTIKDPLNPGDQVILIPDKDLKKWYLVGKAGVIT